MNISKTNGGDLCKILLLSCKEIAVYSEIGSFPSKQRKIQTEVMNIVIFITITTRWRMKCSAVRGIPKT